MTGTQNNYIMFQMNDKTVIGIFSDNNKLQRMEQLVNEYSRVRYAAKVFIEERLKDFADDNCKGIDTVVTDLLEYMDRYASDMNDVEKSFYAIKSSIQP